MNKKVRNRMRTAILKKISNQITLMIRDKITRARTKEKLKDQIVSQKHI